MLWGMASSFQTLESTSGEGQVLRMISARYVAQNEQLYM
jgi:hypothetical protein